MIFTTPSYGEEITQTHDIINLFSQRGMSECLKQLHDLESRFETRFSGFSSVENPAAREIHSKFSYLLIVESDMIAGNAHLHVTETRFPIWGAPPSITRRVVTQCEFVQSTFRR